VWSTILPSSRLWHSVLGEGHQPPVLWSLQSFQSANVDGRIIPVKFDGCEFPKRAVALESLLDACDLALGARLFNKSSKSEPG
jgi:hypothetical protein